MAGAAGVLAPGTASASTSSGWNRIFQPRVSGIFQSIAAISKNNVWAVGDLLQGNKTVYKPYVQHFNGTGWKTVKFPAATMTTDTVQATSASDVWVFGLTQNSKNIASSAAYRWDGARWHKLPVPAYTYLQGTVVLSPSNIWAFGGSLNLPGDVFHWNGSKWKSYNLNFFPQDISASSAGNVWLSGLTWVRQDGEGDRLPVERQPLAGGLHAAPGGCLRPGYQGSLALQCLVWLGNRRQDASGALGRAQVARDHRAGQRGGR